MSVKRYNTSIKKIGFLPNTSVTVDVPDQYQARRITARLKFDFTCANDAVTLATGGWHNLIGNVEHRLSASETRINNTGASMAAFTCMRRRQNIDRLINGTGTAGAIDGVDFHGEKRTFASGDEGTVVVDFPYDFELVNGIRPHDTLFNTYRPNQTDQIIIKPLADFTSVNTGAGALTISNATIEFYLEQVFNQDLDEELVRTLGHFLLSDISRTLESEQQNNIFQLPQYQWYGAFMATLTDASTGFPVVGVRDVVRDWRTQIAQNVLIETTPPENMAEDEYAYGAFADSTDYRAYIPFDFLQVGGVKTANKLTNLWFTNADSDTKCIMDTAASAGNRLRLLYQVFLPDNPNQFATRVFRRRNNPLSAAA